MQRTRVAETQLVNHFGKYSQALVLLGARQVGKSTLLKRIFPEANYLLFDLEEIKKVFESYNLETYKSLLGQNKQVILDEIHLLSNPGRAIKIMHDLLPDLQIIATGSSSFHIKNKTSESLAGRKIEYHLYPLTFGEYLFQQGSEKEISTPFIANIKNKFEGIARIYNVEEIIHHVLSYGLYPELLNLADNKEYLMELSSSSVFKDILELNLIENKAKGRDLLKLLAYQIGNLVNYEEIGAKLSMDRRTVERYIEIFEQSFLLYRLYPYSKNNRKEIGKAPKIYFWDIGLRNAIINNFDDVNLRTDGGALFENFIISEIKKEIDYLHLNYQVNYWRLKSGSEVDLVISNSKELIGCEIKLTSGSISVAFKNSYPEASTHVLNSRNFF